MKLFTALSYNLYMTYHSKSIKDTKNGFTEIQTSRSRRPEHPARTVAMWTSVPVEKTKATLIIYYHRSITIEVDIKCTQTNPFVKHTKSDLSTFQLFQLRTALSNIEKGPTRCEPQFIVRHNSYRECPNGKGSAECLMPSVQSFLSRSLSLGPLNHVEPKNFVFSIIITEWTTTVGVRDEKVFFCFFPFRFHGFNFA